MTRQERLKQCSVCGLRKMDMKKGLICQLTNEYADFEGRCPDFKKDVFEFDKKRALETTGLQVEEVDAEPNKYWKYFKLLLLVVIPVSLLQIGVAFMLQSFSIDFSLLLGMLLGVLIYIPIWIFVGYEIGKLKQGVLAGCMGVVVSILLGLLPKTFNSFFLNHLPFLASAVYFGYATLSNKRMILKFSLFSLVTTVGLNIMVSFNDLGILRDFGRILDQIGYDNDFRSGLLTYQTNSGRMLSFDWALVASISSVLLYLGITFFHQVLEGKQKWGFHFISIGRKMSNRFMAVFVFVCYTGMALLSFGILGEIFSFFKIISGSSAWYNSGIEQGINIEFYIHTFFSIASSIAVLAIFVVFYRRIVLEFYIEREKPIGWNFYFGQIPIVGFFIWIFNLVSWAPSSKLDITKVKLFGHQNNGLATLLTILISLYYLVFLGLSNLNAITLIIMACGVMVYLLYLYNENGLYIYLGLNLAFVLIIIIMEFLGVELPKGTISRGIFWSMAQILLVYPAFHLKVFKIEIISGKREETEVDLNLTEEII